MKRNFIHIAFATILLACVLCLTSCEPDTMPTASAASFEHTWHITVYSPGIDEYMGKTSRRSKYTVTVGSLDDVFEHPYSYYDILTIHRDDGRIELVHMSLVEIEYY